MRLGWLDLLSKPEEIERLWISTCALVETEWPGIVAAARILQDRGEMDGEEFEQVWHAVRPNVAVRERRSRKFGQPAIDLKLNLNSEGSISAAGAV